MRSCIFIIITPVFSVTWSSEIILICWFTVQETFLIIINVENCCAASYLCGNFDIIQSWVRLKIYLFFFNKVALSDIKDIYTYYEVLIFQINAVL